MDHTAECKYLGNDAWNCGHLDNEECCDCEHCQEQHLDQYLREYRADW